MNPLLALIAKGRRRPLRVFHDEAYRLPLSGAEAGSLALETRRSDDALHYLLHAHAVSADEVINPEPVSYEALARVHTPEYLESLHDPATLAQVFAVDPSDIYVDELLRTLRLGVGGTVEAARHALSRKQSVLNLFGGFHHAAPARGAGFCALNDVAVAIAAVRADGFTGRIGVLDFDFHPPDGTAECLGKDGTVWLGSISGAHWGPLPGVDETVLPEGTEDAAYLAAVEALLGRMPEVELAFVLAGADVLTGDRLGVFKLSLSGIRRRELLVAGRLGSLPQVWLPAGGYSSHAWKVLAGAGLTLAFHTEEPIPTDYDPLAARMMRISRTLKTESLGSESFMSDADLAEALGMQRQGPQKLLGYYTAEGLEYALERYRLLPILRRLGFHNLHCLFDRVSPYERARLRGTDALTGKEHTLIELEVDRRQLGSGSFLFVNWLSLRNPRAQFSKLRPQLPGQEVPGLGLAREMSQLLTLMARRVLLEGVAFRPSWYHMAWAARHDARFVDSARQGRFEALVRDLKEVPLVRATRALAEGTVKLNGEPYRWEPDEMVRWRDEKDIPDDGAAIAVERDRCHFTL